MKVKITNEEPYAELICAYIKKQFPRTAEYSPSELIDILSQILIGTKEVRYGCLPSPEHQVVLRQVIREAVEQNRAIPILVPWGSIKSNFSAMLDIAEISAIQQLIQLANVVSEYYIPGVEMVIRVEDTSGYTLFEMEGDQEMIHRNIDHYSADMKTLVKILCPSGNIRVQLESSMILSDSFNQCFSDNVRLMEEYLTQSRLMIQFSPDKVTELPSYKALKAAGWKGIISHEQRSYYLEAYKRLYQGWDEEKMIRRLSLYFAGAMTRHQLHMTGKQSYWDKFIQLAFIPPIKGLPEGYNYNYVYYRTIPLSCGRTHISPWRAKGYLKISGNEVCYKLASFSDTETLEKLSPVVMEITDEAHKLSVFISADYYLES